MTVKQRLSASVDADLLEAGRAAVASGDAGNLSEWVNGALRRQTEEDRRLQALKEFVSAYETEHGTITDEEIDEELRRAKERAIIVRGGRIIRPASGDA